MGRILVVEDNELVQDLLTTLLIKQGYNVISAMDGKEGLDKLVEKPHAVLCDYNMPNVNGANFVEGMRSNKEYDAVCLVTIGDFPESKLREYREKSWISAEFSKPVAIDDITNTLKTYFSAIKVW